MHGAKPSELGLTDQNLVTLILTAGRTLNKAHSNLVVGSQFISGHSHPLRSLTTLSADSVVVEGGIENLLV